MPTHNISLPRDNQRRREDALKRKALRLQIKAGVEALDRGEFTEVTGDDLDSYLEGLVRAPEGQAS